MIANAKKIDADLKRVVDYVEGAFSHIIGTHSDLTIIDTLNKRVTTKDGATVYKQMRYPQNGIDDRSLETALFKMLQEPSLAQGDKNGSGDGTTSSALMTTQFIRTLSEHGVFALSKREDGRSDVKWQPRAGFNNLFSWSKSDFNLPFGGSARLFEVACKKKVPVAERHRFVMDVMDTYIHKVAAQRKLDVDSENIEEFRDALYKVAYTSCGDRDISHTIVDAYIKGGTSAYVTIDDSYDQDDHIQRASDKFVSKKMKLLSKDLINDDAVSAHIVTNQSQVVVIKDHITKDHSNNVKQWFEVGQQCMNSGMGPMIVFCYSCDQVITSSVENFVNKNGVMPLIFVICNEGDDITGKYLDSIAAYCGCLPHVDMNTFLKETGREEEYYGSLDSASFSKQKCVVYKSATAAGENPRYNALVKKLEEIVELKKAKGILESNDRIEMGNALNRLSVLKGSEVVIMVGGKTHAEKTMRSYLAEDAMCAVQSAIDEGIVPGYFFNYLGICRALTPQSYAGCNLDIMDLPKRSVNLLYALSKPLVATAIRAGAYKDVDMDSDVLIAFIDMIDEDVSKERLFTDLFDDADTRIASAKYIHTVINKVMTAYLEVFAEKLSLVLYITIKNFIQKYIVEPALDIDDTLVESIMERLLCGYFFDAVSCSVTDARAGIEGAFIPDYNNIPVLDTFETQKGVLDTMMSIVTSILCSGIFISSLESDENFLYYGNEKITGDVPTRPSTDYDREVEADVE